MAELVKKILVSLVSPGVVASTLGGDVGVDLEEHLEVCKIVYVKYLYSKLGSDHVFIFM